MNIAHDISYEQMDEIFSEAIGLQDLVLALPEQFKNGGPFSSQALLIQEIVRLCRSANYQGVHWDSRASNQDSLQEMMRRPHLLCASYFSDSVILRDGSLLGRRDALGAAEGVIYSMQNGNFRDTTLGRGALLCCLQGAKNEFLKPLYSSPAKEHLGIRNRDGFIKLVVLMLNSFAPEVVGRLSSEYLEKLSCVIYELFANANEHSIFDAKGFRYRRNVRGIYLTYNYLEQSYLDQRADLLSQSAESYLSHVLGNERVANTGRCDSRKIPLLEIGVFDGGQGLVRKWLSKKSGRIDIPSDMTLLEELEILQTCFQKHQTTKSGSGAGEGLDYVDGVLSEMRAYMQVRTSRLFVYKDYRSSTTSSQFQFCSPSEMSDVPGAVISFVIPIPGGN